MCFQERVLYPYFQVFPSWEARARGEGGAVQYSRGERTKEGKK